MSKQNAWNVWGKRLIGLAMIGAVISLSLPLPASAALAGFSKGRLTIVREPDELSEYVTYYKNGEKADPAGMTWVRGRDGGKALLLDGHSEYLELGYAQLKTNRFSFAAWINWQGAAEGKTEDTQYAQRLFTYARRQDHWLSVAPHARDTSKVKDGGYLDGVYLDFHFGGQNGMDLEQFNPATKGISYGIPQGEWHHLAVVADGQSMKLYVDGRLWFEDILIQSMVELYALSMKIGAGFDENSYLHAILDDVGLYEIALTAEQVQMLASGVDPLEEGAALPPSTEPYQPTRPTQPPETSDSEASRSGPATILGLPPVTIYILISVIVVVVGLSVFLSVRQGHSKPQNETSQKKKGGRS